MCAGKWWGPRDVQPVLTMHGWLDNAASFDPLMALLPESLSVLVIDLPGHGRSSHYPPGLLYHFTEDLVTIRNIVNHFGWKKVTMMGHSMGSMFTFIYAAVFPTQVEKIVGFDILRPVPLVSSRFIKNGGTQIDKFIDLINNPIEPPEYEVDDIIERHIKATQNSLTKDSCKILMTRGSFVSKKRSGYVGLTRDIRMRVSLLHSLPHEFLLELTSRIKCEVLNVKFKQGPYYEKKEFYEETLNILRQSAKRLEYHEVEGTHHAHLNNPESVVEIVKNFLCAN